MFEETIEVKAKLMPHPSHTMGPWRSAMVQLSSTPRFGVIRNCINCDAEHAQTSAGEAMHEELYERCD